MNKTKDNILKIVENFYLVIDKKIQGMVIVLRHSLAISILLHPFPSDCA